MSNILAIFVALIAVLYQLDKGTVRINRERRLDLYENLIVNLDEIKSINRSLKRNIMEIYFIVDIEKYKKTYKLMVGPLFYNNQNEDELNKSLMKKRLTTIEKINELEIKLENKLNVLLSNKVLLNPINETEKKDLQFKIINEELNKLVEYIDFVNESIYVYEANKSLIAIKLKKGNLEDIRNNINQKSLTISKAADSIDVINLFLNYSKQYLQCDLINLNSEWKAELVRDYKDKLDHILNRDENVKKIFKKHMK